MEGPIVVATDGRDGAMGALHVALALSKRGSGPVLVLAVQESMTEIGVISSAEMSNLRLLEQASSARMQQAVRTQLQELGPETLRWKLMVQVGSPAVVIANAARDHGCSLLLLGIGRHALADRWLGETTVLRVIQLADVPVLAVAPDTRSLPNVVLVAEDFSDFSQMAGEVAANLLGPGGVIHVAHVLETLRSTGVPLTTYNLMDQYRAEVDRRLVARGQALTGLGLSVQTHSVQGHAAVELLRLANETGAELIAAGRQGRGFVERWLVGSVSSALVRRAECSVLVVPDRAANSA